MGEFFFDLGFFNGLFFDLGFFNGLFFDDFFDGFFFLDDFFLDDLFFNDLRSFFFDGLVLFENVISKQSSYRTLHLRDLLVGSFFDLFFDLVIDDLFRLFYRFFFDNFFYGLFFNDLCNLFRNLLGGSFFSCGGLFFNDLGDRFLCLCLYHNGLGSSFGQYLDGASLFTDLCGSTNTVVTLGIVTLGGANGFVRSCCCGGACNGCCGSGFFNNYRLLGGGLFNDNGFFNDRFLNDLFDNNRFFGNLGLIVVKFPSEVCVCGNDRFVLFGHLRNVIGIKLEGDRGLFLTQIFADQAANDKRFGFGKGILLLVVDLFDIDGRESLLFAGTLHKLKGKGKLAGRVDLVKERCFGILLFVAHVAAVVNGILKRGRFECQIKIEGAGTNVDLCNLRMLVGVGVNGPAHALLGALVAHKRIADSTVILFGCGAGLHQLCLTALAVASNDVATRFFVKANDALVAAKEIAFVFVVVLFCIGFSLRLVLCLELFILVLVNLKLLLFDLGICGGTFAIDRYRTLYGDLALHTELCFELHKFGDRLHHFLGSGADLRLLLALGYGVDGCGVGLLDNLFGGFNDVFFNNGSLSRIAGNTIGKDRTLDRLRGDRACFGSGGNNSGFGNGCALFLFGLLCGLLDGFFIVLGKSCILGGDQIGNCLLCLGIVLIGLLKGLLLDGKLLFLIYVSGTRCLDHLFGLRLLHGCNGTLACGCEPISLGI